MGEYRDGKWTPTFGDEQFGVVDQPLTNRFAESNADALRVIELAKENKRLINVVVTQEDALSEFHAEIERLQKALARSCEDARNERGVMMNQFEDERLTYYVGLFMGALIGGGTTFVLLMVFGNSCA